MIGLDNHIETKIQCPNTLLLMDAKMWNIGEMSIFLLFARNVFLWNNTTYGLYNMYRFVINIVGKYLNIVNTLFFNERLGLYIYTRERAITKHY